MKKIERSQKIIFNLDKQAISILTNDISHEEGVVRSNHKNTACWYSRHNMPKPGYQTPIDGDWSCVRTGFTDR